MLERIQAFILAIVFGAALSSSSPESAFAFGCGGGFGGFHGGFGNFRGGFGYRGGFGGYRGGYRASGAIAAVSEATAAVSLTSRQAPTAAWLASMVARPTFMADWPASTVAWASRVGRDSAWRLGMARWGWGGGFGSGWGWGGWPGSGWAGYGPGWGWGWGGWGARFGFWARSRKPRCDNQHRCSCLWLPILRLRL